MSKDGTENASKWPIILSLFVVGSLVLLYFVNTDVNQFFKESWDVLSSGNEKRIAEWVSQFSWWGPLIVVFVMVAQMFLFVVPSVVVMVVSIIAYGPLYGTIIILTAIFCASSLGYMIGKVLGTSFIEKIVGRKSNGKIEYFLEKYGFWAVFITRISPFYPMTLLALLRGSYEWDIGDLSVRPLSGFYHLPY